MGLCAEQCEILILCHRMFYFMRVEKNQNKNFPPDFWFHFSVILMKANFSCVFWKIVGCLPRIPKDDCFWMNPIHFLKWSIQVVEVDCERIHLSPISHSHVAFWVVSLSHSNLSNSQPICVWGEYWNVKQCCSKHHSHNFQNIWSTNSQHHLLTHKSENCSQPQVFCKGDLLSSQKIFFSCRIYSKENLMKENEKCFSSHSHPLTFHMTFQIENVAHNLENNFGKVIGSF